MSLVKKAGGPLRFTLFIVVGLALFVAIVAVSLWGMDYEVRATVVEKDCALDGSTVTVRESVTRLRHTQEIDFQECGAVQEGYFATYTIRTKHLRIYTEEGGVKVWDSEWLSGGRP